MKKRTIKTNSKLPKFDLGGGVGRATGSGGTGRTGGLGLGQEDDSNIDPLNAGAGALGTAISGLSNFIPQQKFGNTNGGSQKFGSVIHS